MIINNANRINKLYIKKRIIIASSLYIYLNKQESFYDLLIITHKQNFQTFHVSYARINLYKSDNILCKPNNMNQR